MATINTVVTVAQDFIEANDHYALVICHVKTFPHGNAFMPRLYWTRLLYIQAERMKATLRWDENGDLHASTADRPEWACGINAKRSLDHKGNGDAYRIKFHADAYQTAVDEGKKWLAERKAKDEEEWAAEMRRQEEWRLKREAQNAAIPEVVE
jgi:hypothetical protein